MTEMSGDRRFSADTIIEETPQPGAPQVDLSQSQGNEPSTPLMDDAKAYENTKILMDIREQGQAFGLSWFCDGNLKDYAQYFYDRPQKENLIRAWSRIIQNNNITVSPWVDVIQAELFGTGPMLALAFNNRKQRLIIEEQRAEIERLKAQQRQAENEEIKPTEVKEFRNDVASKWEVDDNGYFIKDKKGNYIKAENRKEKPGLSQQEYQLLIKYNGQDKIDKIFKLK